MLQGCRELEYIPAHIWKRKGTAWTDWQFIMWKETLISTLCLALHSHVNGSVAAIPLHLQQVCHAGVLTKWFLPPSCVRNRIVKLLFCEHSSSLCETYCWFIIADSIILHSFSWHPLSPIYYPFLIYSSHRSIYPAVLWISIFSLFLKTIFLPLKIFPAWNLLIFPSSPYISIPHLLFHI